MIYRNEGDVRAAQQARKLAEEPQLDWDTKRKALIDSGMVAERAMPLLDKLPAMLAKSERLVAQFYPPHLS